MSAFVATLGGTLSGALGFQVLARLQAWAKQLSSNGGSLKTEQIPFNAHCLDIWRISQQVKNDLSRDGRNIRKDAWLQLNARFEKALTLPDPDAYEALADALVDHRQTFGEVALDFWLVREFHRNLKVRFCTPKQPKRSKKFARDRSHPWPALGPNGTYGGSDFFGSLRTNTNGKPDHEFLSARSSKIFILRSPWLDLRYSQI
jgi:hypothetical protein